MTAFAYEKLQYHERVQICNNQYKSLKTSWFHVVFYFFPITKQSASKKMISSYQAYESSLSHLLRNNSCQNEGESVRDTKFGSRMGYGSSEALFDLTALWMMLGSTEGCLFHRW